MHSLVRLSSIIKTSLIVHPFIVGQFTIVNVADRLPGLIRRPGITSWSVAVDKSGTTEPSWTEFRSRLSDSEKKTSKITETQFPPANAKELGLEHWCV